MNDILIKYYPQDGHGIFTGRNDDDAGILRQRRFQVSDENAEKGNDTFRIGRVFLWFET